MALSDRVEISNGDFFFSLAVIFCLGADVGACHAHKEVVKERCAVPCALSEQVSVDTSDSDWRKWTCRCEQ